MAVIAVKITGKINTISQKHLIREACNMKSWKYSPTICSLIVVKRKIMLLKCVYTLWVGSLHIMLLYYITYLECTGEAAGAADKP